MRRETSPTIDHWTTCYAYYEITDDTPIEMHRMVKMLMNGGAVTQSGTKVELIFN